MGCRMRWFWRWRAPLSLNRGALRALRLGVVFVLVVSPSGHASEELIQALATRGLLPAPEVYAEETTITWSPAAAVALPGGNFKAQTPQGSDAKFVLVGGPAGAVIADRVPTDGPVAFSAATAKAIGLRPGTTSTVQIVALRAVTFEPTPRTAAPSVDVDRSNGPPRRSEPELTLALPDDPVGSSAFSPSEDVRLQPKPTDPVVLQPPSAEARLAPVIDPAIKSQQAVAPQTHRRAEVSGSRNDGSRFQWASEPSTDRTDLEPKRVTVATPVPRPDRMQEQQPTPRQPVTFRWENPVESGTNENTKSVDRGSSDEDETATIATQKSALAPAATPTSLLAIQAGFFRDKTNADRLTESLLNSDLPAKVRPLRNSAGESRWLVVLGPFATEAARSAARRKGGRLLVDAIDRPY